VVETSLLVINYRSSALAAEAVRSARAASNDPLQVVVVDNSEDPQEIEHLRASGADEIVAAPRNLGYAGGINLGRPRCRGEFLVIANPDVVFRESAISELIDRVRRGAAVTGPRLVWDQAGRWTLPPADMPTLASKGAEVLASWSRSAAAARERDRIRDRIRFWRRTEPAAVDAISGAVLAMRAAVFDRAGGFDERYFLYFEEMDFLRRVSADAPRLIEYVPAAVVRHLYSQSAGAAGDASRRYPESEQIFYRRWYGSFGERLMKLGRPPAADRSVPDELPLDASVEVPASPSSVLVELSPLPDFHSAAGSFVNGGPVQVPAEIREAYRGDRLFLRLVDPGTLQILRSVTLLK
jgi:GT2 family glycosyltransferase